MNYYKYGFHANITVNIFSSSNGFVFSTAFHRWQWLRGFQVVLWSARHSTGNSVYVEFKWFRVQHGIPQVTMVTWISSGFVVSTVFYR
jgi:hypothetical protein